MAGRPSLRVKGLVLTPEPYTVGPKPSLESIGMVIRFDGVGKQDLDFRV